MKKIITVELRTNSKGELQIPPSVLDEMQLEPFETVSLSYPSEFEKETDTRTFFLAREADDGEDTGIMVQLPAVLFTSANMEPDSDIEIECMEGAIVIYDADNEALAEQLAMSSALLEVANELGVSPEHIIIALSEPEVEGGNRNE